MVNMKILAYTINIKYSYQIYLIFNRFKVYFKNNNI